jgi:hypothetical protein
MWRKLCWHQWAVAGWVVLAIGLLALVAVLQKSGGLWNELPGLSMFFFILALVTWLFTVEEDSYGGHEAYKNWLNKGKKK